MPTNLVLQVLEMQSCDVDGNEWMDSFDAWRTEVVKSLLVTFFVQPPEGFSAAGACLKSRGYHGTSAVVHASSLTTVVTPRVPQLTSWLAVCSI
jgi:hypothetical protein